MVISSMQFYNVPFSNLDNDAYRLEQNFSNKNCKSFIITSKANFCATKLNFVFSQSDTADEFLLISHQYIDSRVIPCQNSKFSEKFPLDPLRFC